MTADYELLDAGNGRRLERFGTHIVDRPAPGATVGSNPTLSANTLRRALSSPPPGETMSRSEPFSMWSRHPVRVIELFLAAHAPRLFADAGPA